MQGGKYARDGQKSVTNNAFREINKQLSKNQDEYGKKCNSPFSSDFLSQ